MTQPLAFVIDDDKSLGEAYTQALEICGFNTRHITDSTTALPLIIEHQPDVILLDMQMPRLNGAQVLQAIRDNEKTRHIKVIMASANHLMLDKNISDMANLILQKPVSMDQIMQFAQRMLKSNPPTTNKHTC